MHRVALATAGLLLAATACGGGDDAGSKQPRVIEVQMTDNIKFVPDAVTVRQGETVTFRFRNTGHITHDAFLGDQAAQQAHEAEVKASPAAHSHGPNAITVAPGQTGDLTHTFDQPGTLEIGCHQPDHYRAGMKITVTITA